MSKGHGRHFLQIPGPTNVPERISLAMARAVVDHRGADFPELTLRIFENLRKVFATESPVLIFPSSGTGAWEAALVNTLSPGEKVLAFETGHFSTLWKEVAQKLDLEVVWVEGDWRRGIDPQTVEDRLRRDSGIAAVLAMHNETSTGATSDIAAVRGAMDACNHDALLLVDAVSSLACAPLPMDDWGIDVVISGSQKGLMLPPGLGFNAAGPRALDRAKRSTSRNAYWNWQAMLDNNGQGYFPYTPATTLLYGLDEALAMLLEEGMENVFSRHARHAGATRAAVAAWGLENVCVNEHEFSNSTTAILLPEGNDADRLRKIIRERFNMSLGTGLGKLKGRCFRIGHLGNFNDLMLAGTLSGVEMGLELAGAPHGKGGINAALEFLAGSEQD